MAAGLDTLKTDKPQDAEEVQHITLDSTAASISRPGATSRSRFRIRATSSRHMGVGMTSAQTISKPNPFCYLRFRAPGGQPRKRLESRGSWAPSRNPLHIGAPNAPLYDSVCSFAPGHRHQDQTNGPFAPREQGSQTARSKPACTRPSGAIEPEEHTCTSRSSTNHRYPPRKNG